MTSAPRWLGDFQADFGKVIRTPLDSKTGTFRVEESAYPQSMRREARGASALQGEARLAVYNRQYWFRLFGVLQSAYPLTARLVGHFRFNELVSDFVTRHPPSGWNVDDAPSGFEDFLNETVPASGLELPRASGRVPREPLIEASHIDGAWRRVFFAPRLPPYRPSAEDAAVLLESRLISSPTVALLAEHRPLLELRRHLDDHPGEKPIPLPARLPAPAHWALVRKPAGIGQLPLDPTEARLFELLAAHPVGKALSLLEAECSEAERAALPGKARSWLARSVELDFWSGMLR